MMARRQQTRQAGSGFRRPHVAAERLASSAVIADHAPEPIKRAGGKVVEEALVPTIKAALTLLELAEDRAAEALKPETVLKHHKSRDHQVRTLEDLRQVDLEHLDDVSRRMTLRWRTFGAAEGGVMGVLAMIPVGGTGVSLAADFVVIQMLNTAIASQAMYSYGFDARHPGERQMVERIVRRSYALQASKGRAVKDARDAYRASYNRIYWSEKIRNDHRLLEALERIMQKLGDGSHVPIRDVSKKLPLIGIVTNAGSNAYILGDVAKQGVLYSRTRWLAEKYDLALPQGLRAEGDDLQLR